MMKFSDDTESLQLQALPGYDGGFCPNISLNLDGKADKSEVLLGERVLFKRVDGKVYAIEPQRVVYQMMCANVALSALSNVATYWAAESNRYIHPWAYPGNFRACARNNGTTSAQVRISASRCRARRSSTTATCRRRR